jgi:hypothetical protein
MSDQITTSTIAYLSFLLDDGTIAAPTTAALARHRWSAPSSCLRTICPKCDSHKVKQTRRVGAERDHRLLDMRAALLRRGSAVSRHIALSVEIHPGLG